MKTSPHRKILPCLEKKLISTLVSILYSKISKANEALIVSLVNTFCVPMIMYSMEALDLNVSLLRSLDEPMYNAFGKIFKSFDRPTLRSCMYYMGVLPLRFTFFCRKLKFLTNLSHSTNILITSLFGGFGQADRLGTCNKFEILLLLLLLLLSNIYMLFNIVSKAWLAAENNHQSSNNNQADPIIKLK